MSPWDAYRDLEVDVVVEAGSVRLRVSEALEQLQEGNVITLDHLASEPLDIFVAGRRVAQGECLLDGERVTVRIARIESIDRAGGSEPASDQRARRR